MSNKYKSAFFRMLNALKPISIEQNIPIWRFLIDAMWCFIRYGVTPNEYVGWAFWKQSSMARSQFYTARDAYIYEKRFNDPLQADKFNNKSITNSVFSKYISRDWLYLPDATNEEINAFLRKHKKIIVKPVGLSSGRGIFTINTEEVISLNELKYMLSANEPNNSIENNKMLERESKQIMPKVLLEEFISQHIEMSNLNPTSVNTIRIFTVYNAKIDKVTILSAAMRVGGKDADVDNYHAGGVGYPIDIAHGIIIGGGTGINGKEYYFHPSTGVQVVGYRIPNWSELLEYVNEVCRVVPTGRLIGWDIAITPTGFDLIEANYNADPGLMQATTKRGVKKTILKNL